MAVTFPPPYTPAGSEADALRHEGYALLPPSAGAAVAGLPAGGLGARGVGWD
ncbi:MAG: hypothetical protein GX856_03465, partial [Gammaproteobacteria bacterium]|nr:hypothetical protein [Gammaproteobacteria bacterium]